MKRNIILFSLITVFFISCADKFSEEMSQVSQGDELVLTDDEYTSIAYDNPKELTESEIINIIAEFRQSNAEVGNMDATRSNYAGAFSLVSKYYITSDNSQAIDVVKTRGSNPSDMIAPIYEMELTRAGRKRDFVVVCGDERAAKVLFYCENYSPQDEMSQGTQYMLELSKQSVLADIEFVEKIKTEKRDSTLSKIGNRLNLPKEDVSFERVRDLITTEDAATRTNPPLGVPKPTTRIVAFANPMSKVTWNQIKPYNTQMPYGPLLDESGKHYYDDNMVVGCANVAVGTLFSILKPAMVGVTNTGRQIFIDWEYVNAEPYLFVSDNNPEENSPARRIEMVGSLLRQLYNETKSYANEVTLELEDSEGVKYVKKVWSDTSTDIPDMISYLQKMTNFSGDGYTPFDAELVKQSLMSGKPVLLWGTGKHIDLNGNILKDKENQNPGHGWLIDGFIMTKPSGQSTNDLYWYTNMGWGNQNSKGWFKTDVNFRNCDVVFRNGRNAIRYNTQDQCIIYNIIKK